MICDIFIKTCQHDAAYHEHCLKSIDKFCSGFRKVVVVEGEHPHGYLHQQIVKLEADLHTDADFILMTDSDTLFCRPVTPETYFEDGKVVWVHTPWTPEMLAGNERAWFDVMGQFFRETPPSEFMRRQPFMVPAWLLKNVRDYCARVHGLAIEDYVMGHGVFSEFNVLGFFAWLHHHDEFHWIDSSKDELPELTIRQFWSHDPIGKNIEEIRRILA
jgi:hypothetical protein